MNDEYRVVSNGVKHHAILNKHHATTLTADSVTLGTTKPQSHF